MTQSQTIDTDSLGVASYLHCLGHDLLRVKWEARKSSSRRRRMARFVFHRTDGVERSVSEYHTDRASVNPRLFMEAMTDMRARLYEFLEDENGN